MVAEASFGTKSLSGEIFIDISISKVKKKKIIYCTIQFH